MSEGKKTDAPVKSDKILDVQGFATDEMSKKRLWGLVGGIAVLVLCSLLPLKQYGPTCGLALGMLLATVVFTMTGTLSIGPWSAAMVFIMVITKMIDMNTVQLLIGNGMYLMMIGLCIIGYGIESTPFGERIAFVFLKAWGTKPKRIIFVLFLATAILSSVLSNLAVCMLMSNLGISILEKMGEQKGKSKYGRVLMLSIMAASAVGGVGFLQGSPGCNIYNQQLLQAALGETFTAAQWASIGIPAVLLCIIPVPLIYLKFNKFNDEELHIPGKDFYEEGLAKLGPVGGSEIRWVLMVVGLIVAMLAGANTNLLMLLFIALACAPGLGIIKVKDAFSKAVPWETIFSFTMFITFSVAFTSSGLTAWFTEILSPIVSGMGAFAAMFVLALISGIMTNAMPYGQNGVSALISSIVAPVFVSMGYNAILLVMPAILMVSQLVCLSAHPPVMCSYMFGWYKDKDLLLPGIVVVFFEAILFSLLCYFLGPVLWHTSILL